MSMKERFRDVGTARKVTYAGVGLCPSANGTGWPPAPSDRGIYATTPACKLKLHIPRGVCGVRARADSRTCAGRAPDAKDVGSDRHGRCRRRSRFLAARCVRPPTSRARRSRRRPLDHGGNRPTRLTGTAPETHDCAMRTILRCTEKLGPEISTTTFSRPIRIHPPRWCIGTHRFDGEIWPGLWANARETCVLPMQGQTCPTSEPFDPGWRRR